MFLIKNFFVNLILLLLYFNNHIFKTMKEINVHWKYHKINVFEMLNIRYMILEFDFKKKFTFIHFFLTLLFRYKCN